MDKLDQSVSLPRLARMLRGPNEAIAEYNGDPASRAVFRASLHELIHPSESPRAAPYARAEAPAEAREPPPPSRAGPGTRRAPEGGRVLPPSPPPASALVSNDDSGARKALLSATATIFPGVDSDGSTCNWAGGSAYGDYCGMAIAVCAELLEWNMRKPTIWRPLVERRARDMLGAAAAGQHAQCGVETCSVIAGITGVLYVVCVRVLVRWCTHVTRRPVPTQL